MKISRISQALGSINDEFSREAIEEIEKTSNQNDSAVPDGKPRVIREEKPRKTPIIIALAGLCAAAAIAVSLAVKYVDKNVLVASDNSSGTASAAVEKLGYNLDGAEDYREYKFEFTMPEYEGVAFECTHNKITANGEVIASGMPILQVYLADLNGDGRREIVSDTAFGSGILNKVISACDYSEKQLYMFSNKGLVNYLELFENNGELWVRETEYLGESVLSEKKLELSDMKKIDGLTQVEEKPYSQKELTGENMTVKVDRLKLSHNDRELTAIIDNVSPNVSFLTVTLHPEKCSKFAVVMDENGTFEIFEGDQVSKNKDRSDTSFLDNLPENKFGYMWEYIDGNRQWSFTEFSDKLHNCKHLFDETDGEEVYQVWISNNAEEIRDVCIDFYYNNIDGCTIDIIDNYNGTFWVDSYGSSVSSPSTIIFPKAEIALEAVIQSLTEKTSLSADDAKEYVKNYTRCDLDFDGEAEVLVVNTFGSPAVHVFERKGTTYEEDCVFPMKALEYTGYKLDLMPYKNGDEKYYYFRFFSGGGTMDADVLGAIKQTESGYEMEYLYSWGTLDYKYIAEPVKKEFYRKGWDKYDIALADSNPNDIPKEELAGILKNYGIILE